MWKNLSLRTKIVVRSFATMILIVILGVISINAITSQRNTGKLVNHTHEVIVNANELLTSVLNMESGVKAYLLSGQDGFLRPYTRGKESYPKEFNWLFESVKDQPEQAQRLREAKTSIEAWEKQAAEPAISLRRDSSNTKSMKDIDAFVQKEAGKVYFDEFRDRIAAFIGRESKLMKEVQSQAEETANNSSYTIIGIITLGLVLALVSSFSLAGSIVRPLKEILQGLKSLSLNETG